MELLIPGLILVGLMIYASTRIKRTAAAAFDAETVETDEFIIQKPDGFLTVIGGDPKYLFEGYSKDFGGHRSNFRLASMNVTVQPGGIDAAIAQVPGAVVSDIGEVVGEQHYRVVEATRSEDDVEHHMFYKLAERDGKVYRFEIDALAETSEEFLRKIEVMLASFELK
jgi:hypothetical protein